MTADEQAVIIFGQGARLGRVVGDCLEMSPYEACPICVINSLEVFRHKLRNEKHVCAIANADADPELVALLDSENETVSFPTLFFTNNSARLKTQHADSFGIYDIILQSWICRYTLPKFIDSSVHNHARRFGTAHPSEKTRVNTSLLALISHEIRVPLETLRVTQANLLKFDMSSQAKRLASQSERAIAYMCDYIDNFIEHARLKKGELKSAPEEFCIQTLIQEVIDLVWPKAHIKGVEIDFTLPSDGRLTAYGDRKKLRQILINILSNAVRYTDEGKVAIMVNVEKNLCFEIADTGVGMSKARLKEVFFSDADEIMYSNGCSQAGGLGIGVALCRKLVQFLGGEITADSVEGMGTTVCISVPYAVESRAMENRNQQLKINGLLI